MLYVAILQPNTPITPNAESGASNTLFVGNLAYSVTRADVYVLFFIEYLLLTILAFFTYLTSNMVFLLCRENFFKDCGEVVEVRLASNDEGLFKGFGHVEFATVEAAQKVSF